MVSPAMRTTAVLLGFAMTSGLASDSDKFKIIITLRRAQKFGDTGPYKNFIFFNNPLTDKFFWKFELNAMGRICPMSLKGLNCSIKKRYRLDVGKFKFASRVCDEWNRLGIELSLQGQ